MSALKTDDGKQAVYCLEHLLYEVPFSALHNIAALLAQESGEPVDTFGQSGGHWTFDVVERFLWERGMKCHLAGLEGEWCLAYSPSDLRHVCGFVGFICPPTLESYKCVDDHWQDSKGTVVSESAMCVVLKQGCVAVCRMWSSVAPFYSRDQGFFVMQGASPVRHEHLPGTLWSREVVNVEGRTTAVKAYMREHKRSAILMSNEKEVVLCRPSRHGWSTKAICNFECMPVACVSRRVAEVVLAHFFDIASEDPSQWRVLSHAVFSALHFVGGRMCEEDCSNLTVEDRDALRAYERQLATVVTTDAV